MVDPFWTRLGLIVGAASTLAMFSFLWKENAVYRFFEHVFVGLGMGYTVAVTWTDVLKPHWWDKRIWVGAADELLAREEMGLWDPALWRGTGEILPLWGFLGIVGMFWYFQLSQRRAWLSRIVIGILMGSGAGLIFRRIYGLFFTQDGQVTKSFLPLLLPADSANVVRQWDLTLGALTACLILIYGVFHLRRVRQGIELPKRIEITTTASLCLGLALGTFLLSRGLVIAWNNGLIVLTLICVLCYFLFWEGGRRNRLSIGAATLGRWLLMISFGATFGSTVMARFSLLINRAQYLLEQCLNLS